MLGRHAFSLSKLLNYLIVFQAYFAVFDTSSLFTSDTLHIAHVIVSVQVDSTQQNLRTCLNFSPSHTITPLTRSLISQRRRFVKVLDSFRSTCINPSTMLPIPTLSTHINELHELSSQNSGVHPLTYDTINLPSLERPRPSLKRSSSTSAGFAHNNHHDFKQSSRLISTAIGQIADILVDLKTKLDQELNKDEWAGILFNNINYLRQTRQRIPRKSSISCVSLL